MTLYTLSKSQYIKGLQCPKALWLYRHRKDLKVEPDPSTLARFKAGNAIGRLAMQYFSGRSIEVKSPYWDAPALAQDTQQYIADDYELIFEATAIHPDDGCYARIDILHRVEEDVYDLIEVKGATRVKSYHVRDLAFQHYVFRGAGYNIRNCYMLLVNREYTLDGEIDPRQFFKIEDISERVLDEQEAIGIQAKNLIAVNKEVDEPTVNIGKHCFSPFECEFRPYCWAHAPSYSVHNVFKRGLADEISQRYGIGLEQLPKDFEQLSEALDLPLDKIINAKQIIDINSYLDNKVHVEKESIQSFLAQLRYPLYFLDYEAIIPAIPLFNKTCPFQRIPFQFSLHVQNEPDAPLSHYEYLHTERTDPRPAFTQNLVEQCHDSGSIIVYNKSFEASVNNELGHEAPSHADALRAINQRMLDLLIPFKNRWLYHPKQTSSASLKYVLPAFTSSSYSHLAIGDGSSAMLQYEAFMRDDTHNDTADLWKNLSDYCKQDTYSMVELLAVLHQFSED